MVVVVVVVVLEVVVEGVVVDEVVVDDVVVVGVVVITTGSSLLLMGSDFGQQMTGVDFSYRQMLFLKKLMKSGVGLVLSLP